MGRCIIKLAENEYIEWSTISDAPSSYVVTREGLINELRKRTINDFEKQIEESFKRADKNGSSWLGSSTSAEDAICHNRAGKNERHLSLNGIRKKYKQK